MSRFFIYLYHLIRKNQIIAILFVVIFLFICGFFASKINFDEDINQIIPKNEKSDLTAKILKQLSFSDKIIVIIEQKGNPNEFGLSETADAFLEKIKPWDSYIKSVQGKIDDDQISETFGFINENIPLFLEEKDYLEIENKLQKDSIAKKVEQNYIALVSPTSLVTKEFIKEDPLGISLMGLKKLNALNISNDFKLENNYVVTKDGKNLLLFLEPKFGGSETKNNEQFVNQLDAIKNQLNIEFKGKTETSYFGSPMIAVANAKQIKKDIQSTVMISAAVLVLLLIFYFRNFFTPLIIFIPTIFGAAAALLAMFFIKDKISAISLSVSAILIGITIDYAIHILTHFKHNHNIEEVFKEITPPIVISSATTAISFLCLIFVRSEALKDLGIFACIAVLLSAFFSLVIIPQIYNPKKNPQKTKPTFIDKIGAYPYEKNKWLIIVCSVLIFISFFGFRHIKFNQNINDLNYIPKEMKENEAKLEKLSNLTSKSIYLVSYGNTEAEALEKNAKLFSFLKEQKQQNKILDYNSVGQLVLSEKEQQEKIRRWNNFWTENRKAITLTELHRNGEKFGFNNSAFENFQEMLHKNYKPLKINEYKNLKALQLQEFLSEGNGIYTASTVVKIDEKNRNNFIKNTEENNEVMAIDRQQLNENFLGLLKDDFNSLINYSLIAVILIFILFFRNIDLTILATIPILLSGVVTAGILYFLGLELNIFSTIVCTLIFGAGVDFNIFLTQALQKEITTGKNQLPIYRVSIILALLTTVLAIGALVFAKHPALYSVSVVALIGMLAVVIISFSMYPLLFSFVKYRTRKGLSPVTFRIFFHSLFSFIYYGLGGFIFSFIGHFFIPKLKKTELLRFKKMMALFLKSVLYGNPFVKKKVINEEKETFDKPAIIIANHTSFLDTLTMALATHKVIYLVNDWVYSSPIFGKMVRALGFYPVSQGIENGTEKLKEKVNQGFSLVVFPEGQRSPDNEVRRFHKGAFFLAEEFGLDILPIYIHGNSEVLPRDDYMNFDGSMTIKIGERIDKDDKSFGTDYSERSKKINAFFRKEFAKLRNEIEDENYFKKKLFLSFLYKENEVVNTVKKDFNKNKKEYLELNSHIGKDDVILHISSDYGQKDVLLALQQARRIIYSFNPDKEKREISKQNYLVKCRKIFYIDEFSEILKKPSVLLISDKNFDWAKLTVIPNKIIFFDTEPFFPENINYKLKNKNNKIIIYDIH